MDRDYSKGKIYKLVSQHTDEKYIGSTILPLNSRLRAHRNSKNCCSKKLFELGNVEIILLEAYPCNSNTELRKRERHWYDTSVCINLNKPYVSPEEKIDLNRLKAKNYTLNNKEKVSKQRKKFYKENQANDFTLCDCGSLVLTVQLRKHFRSIKHKDYLEDLRN